MPPLFIVIKKIVLQNIQPGWIEKILIILFKWRIKIMIEFPDNHLNFAFWTVKRIYSKSYVHLPLIKWIFWYGNIFPKRLHSLFKFIGNMSWIETVPVYHFKVFRRQMNENLWDKFFSRHSNESFLFIVSQVIEKEGNIIIINFGNLVFCNRWTCEVSSEVSDNTLCAVDVTVTDIKEESFILGPRNTA